MTAWLGISQLLLLRFLGIISVENGLVGAGLLIGLCWGIVRSMRSVAGPIRLPTILWCFGFSLVLFALGGEGRLFYANVDWQVRDAVLRDMAINPWPFVYTARGFPDVLRAPIGMFFLPALAYKQWGAGAADWALLLQNALLLTAILSLGSTLFATGKQKGVALVILVFFSGLDLVGQWLLHRELVDHLESWSKLEYSSTVTLAFWVPQHALAGWTVAVLFLLWRAGKLPPAPFLTLLPLTAIWSPFALIGSMPFAIYVAASTLRRHRLTGLDFTLPVLSTMLAAPSLLYLSAAGDAVGIRAFPVGIARFIAIQMIETIPYLAPLIALTRLRGADRWGAATLGIVTVWLFVAPFIQIGWSIDFMMRATIPAFAILAVMVADAIMDQESPRQPAAWLIVALVIGSVTALMEIRSAVLNPVSPRVSCTFFKAWEQTFSNYRKDSYLAPLSKMPAIIAPPAPYHVSSKEPTRCWNGLWVHPTGV
ncbi:hypothetical protein FHS92_001269 [Sphingobium subterraneum]|uniref:Uncharacterized protein n=2 Tax=Sphingobium subterraneum TaxID=627688 RepID=A0A841IZL6_9SPHN|nr:hypothetical protein [Sphingobium subterraneum]